MDDWFERWQRGEASVVYGQSGPDSRELIEGHNAKDWFDEATDEEVNALAAWVEAHYPVVLIYGNWHRLSDGRLMCDSCYEKPVETYSTICGGASLCSSCSKELSDAYWYFRYRQIAREQPHTLLPRVRALLKKQGFEF
jgi:hypothetical protein